MGKPTVGALRAAKRLASDLLPAMCEGYDPVPVEMAKVIDRESGLGELADWVALGIYHLEHYAEIDDATREDYVFRARGALSKIGG